MSIKVHQLSKVYGSQRAVDNISFEIARGEVVGLLGPNGAGKTTTMKMITTYIPQNSGEVTVCGFDTVQQPLEIRKRIGYLPENNPLYLEMYVQEYLRFVARCYRLKNYTKRIAEMIELTGLSAESGKKIGALSKGYRQRVGLAQALLHDPEVLILDEPTSGLDPNQLLEVRNLIKTLGKEKTVILSTHIMQEVEAVCSRVIIIHKGKIVADDTTERLQRHLTDKATVKAEFKEDVPLEQLKNIQGVSRVQRETSHQYLLYGNGSNDLREQVFRFAVEKGYTLLTLYQPESDLEEVFKNLTSETAA
ncbi:MAG: gliding motility-associated ABC transporter ATP-binding subunit GldA [Chitinophagales bacterium]|nr:MAG: gliding motility-associated ABC transporter ATP-binding subunit GldA [Chitinophagales bacterium]